MKKYYEYSQEELIEKIIDLKAELSQRNNLVKYYIRMLNKKEEKNIKQKEQIIKLKTEILKYKLKGEKTYVKDER